MNKCDDKKETVKPIPPQKPKGPELQLSQESSNDVIRRFPKKDKK